VGVRKLEKCKKEYHLLLEWPLNLIYVIETQSLKFLVIRVLGNGGFDFLKRVKTADIEGKLTNLCSIMP